MYSREEFERDSKGETGDRLAEEARGRSAEGRRFAYHAHLDACHLCRTQPFDQCPIGMSLLVEAVRRGD